MKEKDLGLTKKELSVLKRLNTPIKIQDYLDTLPINHEKGGETYMSPRRVLREKKAHCLEGAMLAALALWLAGKKPLLMDLKTSTGDDHVVALFKQNGCWGAISKTNHILLRFRDPVYRTLRELAISYFQEYTNYALTTKILRSYSRPLDLSKWKTNWITAEEELFSLAEALDDLPHYSLVSSRNLKLVRRPDKMEAKLGKIEEWSKDDPRT